MPITKKHTALALAGAALIQTFAYGGYKLGNPLEKGGAMAQADDWEKEMAERIRRLREAGVPLLSQGTLIRSADW